MQAPAVAIAKAEIARGHNLLHEGKIFRKHVRPAKVNARRVLAQLNGHISHQLGAFRRVVPGRITDARIVKDVRFAAEGFRLQVNQRLNPLTDQFPRAPGAGANPDLQARFTGNNGGERPGIERTNRDHGGIMGINIARDDGLERQHNSRSSNNGVRRHVRQCAVSAQALYRHFNNINRSRNGPGPNGNLPRFITRNIMERENRIAGKALEQPLFDHALSPAHIFFGRLKNQVHCSIKIQAFGQVARRPQQHGGVAVMATGMHLAGATRYLAGSLDFDGTVHLIFQPAEEDISGAKRMIEEGLFKRFPCDAVFALHNIPGDETGQISVRPGAITAAVDIVEVTVQGLGGHGALPHMAADPIVAASGIVLALQTIVARNVDPHDPAVITVGSFNAGALATIIPGEARLKIGVRTCTRGTRELIRERIESLVDLQAKALGCEADIVYNPGISYPPGYNTPECAELVRNLAIELGQDPARIDLRGPYMFSEDFAFMQEVVPSCYFGLGNGNSRSLHDSGYDFNDELLVKGPVFWGKLVERFLKAA